MKKQRKPERYRSRDEIEAIVKRLGIDRERFYEYSKTGYKQVLDRFYYSFADCEKHPEPHLDYVWLHFREGLRQVLLQRDTDHESSLDCIKQYFDRRGSCRLFLILNDGWVYEGYIGEMIAVLSETDGITIEDFYIITPEFDAFAMYCSDGECISIYTTVSMLQ